MKIGDMVIVHSLSDIHPPDLGLSERETEILLSHEGEKATIDSIACQVSHDCEEDGCEEDYFNITFEDGYHLEISGYNLEKVV